MAELKITKDNFKSEVLDAKKPVLLDFWAGWCGPCMMISPLVAEIAEELGDKLTVGKVNVDEEMELAMQYRIASIPALLLFKDGKAVSRNVGYQSKQALLKWISDNT